MLEIKTIPSETPALPNLFIITFGNVDLSFLTTITEQTKILDWKDYNFPVVVHEDNFLLISDSQSVSKMDIYMEEKLNYSDIVIMPLVPEGSSSLTGAIHYNHENFQKIVKRLYIFISYVKLSPMGTDATFNNFQSKKRPIYFAEKNKNKPLQFLGNKPGSELREMWVFFSNSTLCDENDTLENMETNLKKLSQEICDYELQIHQCWGFPWTFIFVH